MRKSDFTLCPLPVHVRVSAVRCTVTGSHQYPVVDMIANEVIQKYQNTSCDDLKAKKQQPPSAQKESPMEQKAVEELKNNPDMRQHFLDKVAGPIANKMLECGRVP